MLQKIQGKTVYVFDLKEIPKTPITWEVPDEKPYAQALEMAIFKEQITEPGKYGIHIKPGWGGLSWDYDVYAIQE
jgi:hypothetical protein